MPKVSVRLSNVVSFLEYNATHSDTDHYQRAATILREKLSSVGESWWWLHGSQIWPRGKRDDETPEEYKDFATRLEAFRYTPEKSFAEKRK